MASDKILTLGEENWKTAVQEAAGPILVDFWATWCGPCRSLAPILEQLAEEMGDRLQIGKVNVDDNQSLAAKFGIRSIPTLLLFQQGAVVGQINGAMPKQALQTKVEGMLGNA